MVGSLYLGSPRDINGRVALIRSPEVTRALRVFSFCILYLYAYGLYGPGNSQSVF